MNYKYKIISCLSIVLLMGALSGQVIWLYKVRKVRVDEFYQYAYNVLNEVSGRFIGEQEKWLNPDDEPDSLVPSSLSVPEDTLKQQQILYDLLFQSKRFDLQCLDSLYRQALRNQDEFKLLFLQLQKSQPERVPVTESSPAFFSALAIPVELGFHTRHRLVAVFEVPFFFRAWSPILILEGVFLLGFLLCLVWQCFSLVLWHRTGRGEILGIAHLEHELQKPLCIMISAINGLVVNKTVELSGSNMEKLLMMRARLLKMADTVDTMLTTVKKSRLNLRRTEIDIDEELEKVREMFGILKPHARLVITVAEGLQNFWLDDIYFNYLLINLVDNAIKYGGDPPVVKIDCWQENNNFVLAVEDNGMGIPQKERKRIFRYFYRVKNKKVASTTGFGLGLSFVRQVVRAYDGEIVIESKLGQGSKFIIILPQ